ARRQYADAAATLEPLLAGYPAHVQLRVLACHIELARGGSKDAKAIATCDRAAVMSAEVGPALEIASAHVQLGDLPGAHARRVASLPPDKAAAEWLKLAEAYLQLGALTSAELALAHAGPGAHAQEIADAVVTQRMRYGVPHDGKRWKLERDNEAEAVYAVHET